MSWYNPASWGQGEDPNKVKSGARTHIGQQAQASGNFAGYREQDFGQLGLEAQNARDYLQRLASGQDSVSAEQLRQGLQQNLAGQRSLAAAASPQNSAMAARTAAMQAGRLGAGLAGQQAVAGLQERQQAQQLLNNAILGQQQLQLQGALGARQNALNGYLGVLGGPQNQGYLQQNMEFAKAIGGMVLGGGGGGGGGK